MVRKCPKCKTDEYNNKKHRNDDQRMWASVVSELCGEYFCEKRESLSLRRMRENVEEKQFLGATFGRSENRTRKLYSKTFWIRSITCTKTILAVLKAYNDYLEELEDVVFNLVNEIDVEETERRIKIFKESY